MKHALLLFLLLFVSVNSARTQKNPSVMIHSSSKVDKNSTQNQKGESALLADTLVAQLGQAIELYYPCANYVTDKSVGAVLNNERDRELLSSGDPTVLNNIAQSLGTQYIINATVTQVGGQEYMTLSAMDMKTAKPLFKEDANTKSGEAAFDKAGSLANKFATEIASLFSVKPTPGKSYPSGTVFQATCKGSYHGHALYETINTQAWQWSDSLHSFAHGQNGDYDCATVNPCTCDTCTCTNPATIKVSGAGRYQLVDITDHNGPTSRTITNEVKAEITIAGECRK